MTVWTTQAIVNEHRDLAPDGSLLGTKVTDVSNITITEITMNFTVGEGITATCYIQESDGTITKFGSDYVNNSAENHTFIGNQHVTGTNFIIYAYGLNDGTNKCRLGVQIDDAQVTIGTEVGYHPKTLTPTYASWASPACNTNCGIYMNFVYSGGGGAAATRLPPSPITVRF